MSDTNERLERQMEGTNLALAAVAEVLQKMDDRLNKAEEQEYIMELFLNLMNIQKDCFYPQKF